MWTAAACGDPHAWAALVEAHAAEVWEWAVEATTDLQQARRVSEMTWLRCVEDLRRPTPVLGSHLRGLVRREADRERARGELSWTSRCGADPVEQPSAS